MTEEEWWSTPFPYKARVPIQYRNDAEQWLIDRGYVEWAEWNQLFTGGSYWFDFLNEEAFTLFALAWADR